MLSPTELHLLQVILGGARRMSCQMQLWLLSLTEHHITYSTIVGNLLRGQILAMTVLDCSSFLLNQLPYLRTASIKHRGRCFSAAHCRGNASRTLCKYTSPFPSLILMVHFSVGIFLFQRAKCSLHLRVKVGSRWKRMATSWPQEVCYKARRLITNSWYVNWDI